MSLLLHGGDLYTPNTVVRDGAVLVRDRRIAAVGPLRDVAPPESEDVERIDVRGGIIAPGFVDLQINGAAGLLFTEDPTMEALAAMAAALPQFGCTSFLPTLLSCSEEVTHRSLAAAAKACARPPAGAQVLGVHMEGPFLNPDRAGAHDRNLLPPAFDGRASPDGSRPATALFASLTLAPELPGASKVISEAVRGRVAVAVGHTAATYDETAEAAHLGASLVTHLFNATGGLSARQPGAVGAALALDELSASLIADGVHVHPAVVRAAVRAKGVGRVALVTDSMPPVGTAAQEFSLLGRSVSVRNGACRLADGTLAGSTLTMDQALRNVIRMDGTCPCRTLLAWRRCSPPASSAPTPPKAACSPGWTRTLSSWTATSRVVLTLVGGQVVYHSSDFCL